MDALITIEGAQSLEYLSMVLQETLRMHCIASDTSNLVFSRDTKVGSIDVRAGQSFRVDINALHLDEFQWQKPLEFIPERFDSSNPVSLTPNGKKRHPYSYAPFSGGKRICFRKSFAEISVKIASIYLT